MNRKMRRQQSKLSVEFPPPFVLIRMDQVLWAFAQCYHKMYAADHPHPDLSKELAAIAMLMAQEEIGRAIRYTDPDGTITWRASPKFLRETGLEPGSLVTIGPFTSTH
jgi:hypothetical protein